MTWADWLAVVQRMRGWWPQASLGEEQKGSIALWFDDLRDHDTGQVLAAVEAFYRDGNPWPPNGAQILNKLADLSLDAKPFERVWALGHDAASMYGQRRWEEAREWLLPQIGTEGVRLVEDEWRTFCLGSCSDRTRYAQTRDLYAERVRSAMRRVTYAGIPAAGLAALERSSGEPRQVGAAVRALLEGGPR